MLSNQQLHPMFHGSAPRLGTFMDIHGMSAFRPRFHIHQNQLLTDQSPCLMVKSCQSHNSWSLNQLKPKVWWIFMVKSSPLKLRLAAPTGHKKNAAAMAEAQDLADPGRLLLAQCFLAPSHGAWETLLCYFGMLVNYIMYILYIYKYT